MKECWREQVIDYEKMEELALVGNIQEYSNDAPTKRLQH
jgi:hypothetical protein